MTLIHWRLCFDQRRVESPFLFALWAWVIHQIDILNLLHETHDLLAICILCKLIILDQLCGGSSSRYFLQVFRSFKRNERLATSLSDHWKSGFEGLYIMK